MKPRLVCGATILLNLIGFVGLIFLHRYIESWSQSVYFVSIFLKWRPIRFGYQCVFMYLLDQMENLWWHQKMESSVESTFSILLKLIWEWKNDIHINKYI